MSNKLYIFDFDDTLCISNSEATVTPLDPNEKPFKMDSRKWRDHAYDEKRYLYDMSQFNSLAQDFQANEPILAIAQRAYKELGSDGVLILTARSSPQAPKEFLDLYNMTNVGVMAIGSAADGPGGKAQFIENLIKDRNLTQVEYYEDSTAQLMKARALASRTPKQYRCILNVHQVD